MDLMTIGAFAERTRLSPKALRLYDRLGLLPPARTDPASGYRFYSQDQVDAARLVALLRRIGMPLPLPAVDALEAWMHGQRRGPAGPLRQVLIADQRTAAPDTLVCDLSVPLK